MPGAALQLSKRTCLLAWPFPSAGAGRATCCGLVAATPRCGSAVRDRCFLRTTDYLHLPASGRPCLPSQQPGSLRSGSSTAGQGQHMRCNCGESNLGQPNRSIAMHR